jgi:hypothetical protein
LTMGIDGSYLARKRYPGAVIMPLLLFTIGAVLASSVNVAVLSSGGSCGPGVEGGGFPWPWNLQTIPYPGPRYPIASLCRFVLYPTWGIPIVSFLADMAFYGLLGIGIFEVTITGARHLHTGTGKNTHNGPP